MAGAGTAQERLNRITEIIASDMEAEVCSVYVRRAGDVLELFSTRGLKPSAVHHTRLRIGEGLIGDIAAHARPLALADARSHPNFVFRPETGEEVYRSLMGAPILRDGRVIGVVAVQNGSSRRYAEEEIETLQTVAMVLAELIAAGNLVGREELQAVDGIAVRPLRLEGLRLNAGQGAGTAVLHEPKFTLERLVAEDPEAEGKRLHEALTEMRGALDDMLRSMVLVGGGEHQEILEAYRMIAEDAGWLKKIEDAIGDGLTAEAAVKKVQDDIRARMAQITDAYLRERVHDFDDLANRLLRHLSGAEETSAARDLPEDVILVARSMGPAQLLDYDSARIRGLVLEEGSPTAHVAIVARALDIPVVGNLGDVLDKIDPGDSIVVDGDNAQVFIRPGEEVLQAFRESKRAHGERQATYVSLKDLPAVTLDGEAVGLNINAGLLMDMDRFKESGADGVGLYRTEVPFMVRPDFPDVEAQQSLYAKILERAGGKPVVFRTLDIGGDKVLPYWNSAAEENPAMGWRAIRISLDRPSLMRHQLRALIRAALGKELKIMFPMIAEVSEFKEARELLNLELERERKNGRPVPEGLSVGVMLEVPALLFQLPALLEAVDFVSIGSNDLFQFLFACDRGSSRLSERYCTLSPVVLGVLRSVSEQCRDAGVSLSLCGEMAGNPLDAMALIGAGVKTLSVSPKAVGPVKAMIRSLSAKPLRSFMEGLYGLPHRSLREMLRAYAKDHGVII